MKRRTGGFNSVCVIRFSRAIGSSGGGACRGVCPPALDAAKIGVMTNFQLRGLSMLCASALMQTGLMYGKEDAAAKRLQESATVLQEVMDAGDKSIPQDLLNKAQCMVIVPGLKKGAFIIGAKYGRGYLSCRGKDNIGWTAPGAVRVEGGSVGFQIGGSEVDVFMLVLNPRGAEKLLSSKFTLGADASVAAGPVGRTSSAETDAAMRAEILTWSRSRGLFAGIALNGATLRPDLDANAELYGKKVKNADIVAGKLAMPTAAAPLIDKLTKYSARK
jgi:lipid-binding SYLF domain-containing protein